MLEKPWLEKESADMASFSTEKNLDNYESKEVECVAD